MSMTAERYDVPLRLVLKCEVIDKGSYQCELECGHTVYRSKPKFHALCTLCKREGKHD